MDYAPAGFWIRLVATIVDGIILGIINAIIQIGVSLLLFRSSDGSNGALIFVPMIFGFIANCFYAGWFYSRKGATPGKMALGMRVLHNETGEYLSFGQACMRDVLGKLLSSLTLGIGYLMVAFRDDKRALHDLVASSCVVRVKSE